MDLTEAQKIWNKNRWVLYPDDPYGVVGLGGELTTQRLLEAYATGVFPWPQGEDLVWFCPPQRGVLYFDELKIPKRLQRKIRTGDYELKMNSNLAEVIDQCATAPRRGQLGTWITPQIKQAYLELQQQGRVLSFECWRKDQLLGGLYGVKVEESGTLRYFSGESVFGIESDVSKICLLHCIDYLKSQGLDWLDIQMVTKLTETFGGRYISREAFLRQILSL